MADQIQVRGTAIRAGVSRNGITYTKEELNKFAKSFKGKPVLKDHESRTDNTIGKLTSGKSINNGSSIDYEGWVKEDGTGIIEKIQDGRASEVSIGAHVAKIVENEDGEMFAVGMELMELSTTPTPGVKGTSLNQALESIKNGKQPLIAESFDILKTVSLDTDIKQENMEVNNMADEEPKVETPVEEPVVEKPVVEEPKEEPKAEEPKAEEPKADESHKINVEVDSTGIDEAILKAEKLVGLKQKLNEKVNKVEDIKENTKGKIVKDEVKEDVVETGYVVEQCSFGEGASIWKHPKDDGTLM